jgi:hypothetical protein
MEKRMKQIECDLPNCSKRFVPRVRQQRFCCAKHRETFHRYERARIIKLVRDMGIGK